MLHLTREHWDVIARELRQPTETVQVTTVYQPKFTFRDLPASLDAVSWTPDQLVSIGFPYRPYPTKVPATLDVTQWDAAVSDLLQEGKLDYGWIPPLNEVRGWLAYGCPPYLTYPGTLPTATKHNIPEEQLQMCLDSMARFQKMVSNTLECYW